MSQVSSPSRTTFPLTGWPGWPGASGFPGAPGLPGVSGLPGSSCTDSCGRTGSVCRQGKCVSTVGDTCNNASGCAFPVGCNGTFCGGNGASVVQIFPDSAALGLAFCMSGIAKDGVCSLSTDSTSNQTLAPTTPIQIAASAVTSTNQISASSRPSSTPSATRSSNTPAIIGGVIGGLTLITLMLGLFVLMQKYRRRHEEKIEYQTWSPKDPETLDPEMFASTGPVHSGQTTEISVRGLSPQNQPGSESADYIGDTESSSLSLFAIVGDRFSEPSEPPGLSDGSTSLAEHPPLGLPAISSSTAPRGGKGDPSGFARRSPVSEEPSITNVNPPTVLASGTTTPATGPPGTYLADNPVVIEQQLVAIRDQVERELAELRFPAPDEDLRTDGDIPPRYSLLVQRQSAQNTGSTET